MANFIPYSQYPGNQHRVRVESRLSYLMRDKPFYNSVRRLIKEYFSRYPGGDQVTLYVFKESKEFPIDQALADRFGKALPTLKKDIGLLIPTIGAELYGSGRFHTYRNGTKNSTRPVPEKMKKLPIKRYTPHCLKDEVAIRSLFGMVSSNEDGIAYQQAMREE